MRSGDGKHCFQRERQSIHRLHAGQGHFTHQRRPSHRVHPAGPLFASLQSGRQCGHRGHLPVCRHESDGVDQPHIGRRLYDVDCFLVKFVLVEFLVFKLLVVEFAVVQFIVQPFIQFVLIQFFLEFTILEFLVFEFAIVEFIIQFTLVQFFVEFAVVEFFLEFFLDLKRIVRFVVVKPLELLRDPAAPARRVRPTHVRRTTRRAGAAPPRQENDGSAHCI